MKYFKDIKNFEDLKKQFRILAMKYHPDRPSGDSEIMKAINNEYDILFPMWKDRENIKSNETANSDRNEFYTSNGWKGDKYDRDLTTKEIAKRIREQLKKEYSDCKFSVKKHEFSGGASISVTIKETPKSIYATNNDIINYSLFDKSENDDNFNAYGNKLIKDIFKICNSYRYSDCDGMIDYFCTNFYLTVNAGEYGETVKVVRRNKKTTKKSTKKENDKKIDNSFKIVENYEKHGIELYFDNIPTEEFRSMLKQFSFKWNRNKKCWYAKKTNDIMIVLENIQSKQLPA